MHSARDINKNNPTLIKKSSNGVNLDETSQANQAQMKLMPILEGGENEDKLMEQPTRFPKKMLTTIDWTPTE